MKRLHGVVETEIDKKFAEALLLDIAEGNNDEDWFGDVDDMPTESNFQVEKDSNATFQVNYSKASLHFHGTKTPHNYLECKASN
ncbi:hypothetical protein CLOM_g7491 [Closterium sp. NIES-68]|nr:hypothetical protein CLOM_g7491 [Closterium sp. NIES-68]GJP78039.1 hypothetical protein CLOP_g8369 [Closterium sp. NIES-67]